jgi:phospholipid/cholesterol/gamma-HCH transport system substrate-binding protein
MKLETKVGAFFVAALAILGTLILRTDKLDLFGSRSQSKLLTEFDQVAGLSLQSAIRVAGVKVGEVADIQLDGKRARVTLSVPKDFPVYQDAVVSLSSIGILGEKYVELDPGHPEAGPLPGGSVIPSKAGVGLDTIMENLGAISKDVKGVTYAMNQSIGGDQGREKLDEIIDNIRQLTGEFRAMAQENHGAINATIGNVQEMTGQLKDNLPRITKQFEDLGKNLNDMVNQGKPELVGLLGDVRKLTASLQATSDNAKSITDKINNGQGTIGKLLNDPATIEKVNTAVDNVNSMLGGFRSMDLDLDLHAADWTRRSDSAAGLNIDFVPSHDHWYSLGFNSTPDGKIGVSSATTTVEPNTGLPNDTVTSYSKTVHTDQTFTLSALFDKRLAEHFVLSAGIIENTGGASAEYRALDDRFRLGAMGYDFQKRDDKPNPRYRITSSYQFYKGIYGQVGGQDLANKDLRTFFIGGGLRWTDEDLKKLVGLVSVGK